MPKAAFWPEKWSSCRGNVVAYAALNISLYKLLSQAELQSWSFSSDSYFLTKTTAIKIVFIKIAYNFVPSFDFVQFLMRLSWLLTNKNFNAVLLSMKPELTCLWDLKSPGPPKKATLITGGRITDQWPRIVGLHTLCFFLIVKNHSWAQRKLSLLNLLNILLSINGQVISFGCNGLNY